MSWSAIKPIAVAYSPDWAAYSDSPSKIDFSKLDVLWFGNESQATLKALVSNAHASGHGRWLGWLLEYPNFPGAGNKFLPSDSANFLALLKLLRTKLGSSKIISTAVAHEPWLGSNGRPLSNVPDFAAQLSLNYDVNGSFAYPDGSMTRAEKNWSALVRLSEDLSLIRLKRVLTGLISGEKGCSMQGAKGLKKVSTVLTRE
ncbi:hypothetical protein C8J56DRAFT_1111644 [Mycena floridula]|nr:hypothetical protein C8J56DRAFT_1111644 [Mycena floridula]